MELGIVLYELEHVVYSTLNPVTVSRRPMQHKTKELVSIISSQFSEIPSVRSRTARRVIDVRSRLTGCVHMDQDLLITSEFSRHRRLYDTCQMKFRASMPSPTRKSGPCMRCLWNWANKLWEAPLRIIVEIFTFKAQWQFDQGL